ncbi:nicotinate-nucleotide--dimethylbenzimidazole phosphoribosyltransferase [Streptomyces sp. NBC_00390]|uniref:nicotinate-nucleotide--dimethylbenzimidazole phosphoribosyltransferase n=1 Tax=Streptomyces sp. NBC_00390 TaxID=2975736 RepID=UPI002E1BF642
MTDTGQIPGEGLPENAGMVEQPGIPAPGAYTYLDPSEHTPEEDDLLLMPGTQGAWSDPQQMPPGAPVTQMPTGQLPGLPGAPLAEQYAAAGHAVDVQGSEYHSTAYQPEFQMQGLTGSEQSALDQLGAPAQTAGPQSVAAPDIQPVAPEPAPPSGPDAAAPAAPEFVAVAHAVPGAPVDLSAPDVAFGAQQSPVAPEVSGYAAEPLLQAQGTMSVMPGVAPDPLTEAVAAEPAHAEAPAPAQAAQEMPVHETPAHETGAHEAGGRDSGSVDLGAVRVPAAATSAMPTPPPARRPLHMGPPVPDNSGGVVRSLADRGPADTPPHAMVVRNNPAPPTMGLEYLDGPRDDAAVLPGPQLGEIPPQAGIPWDPQPPFGAETVVPHDAPEPLAAAEPAVEATVPAPRVGDSEVPLAVAETAAPLAAETAEVPSAVEPAELAPQPEPVADVPQFTDETVAAAASEAEVPVAEAAPEPEPEPEVAPEGVPVPVDEAVPGPEAVAEAAPAPEAAAEPVADLESGAQITVEAAPATEAAPVPEAVVVPAPEPAAASELAPEAAAESASEAAPEAEPAPDAAVSETVQGSGSVPDAGPEAAPEAVAEDPPAPDGDAGPAPAYDDAEREAVLRVMRERRDIRNGFRSDPIPHEVLLRVLEAAHTAPSVGHSQPWDFVVIRSAETRRTMHELAQRQREAYAKSLPKGRAKQFKELKIEAILDTPVNIVVTADSTRGGRHTLGRHTQPQMAPYSSALAVENLWLAARAEGLGVGWVSFFDEREMVRALGLPEHLEVVAYLCVGYVDEFPQDPELLQAGWSKRRPLSWVVHEETYGRRALPGEEPHDLLQETVANIRPLDAKALGEAWERQKRMTKPAGALGMLEIISAQLSGLSRMCPPPIPEPAAVAIFAGDHGVHAQGVTAWPQEVTAQMVANFLGGGAVCNAFANQVGAEVCVIDVGVAGDLPATPGLLPRKVRPGTSDFTTGPALTREEALTAIEVGIETARDLVAAGNKALLTGEMGIANTTTSAALISVYTDADPTEITGRGTGINDEMHARKVDVVRRALELHRPDPADPIGVLASVGGLEHAALVGFILGGASLRTPVVLDGVSAGAAALVARAIAPEALAACIAGHRSAEPGHVAALNKLGLRPLVDLDLRLGEGTGALLALPLVQSAARAMHEVATFDSAGVTEK